MQVIYGGPFGPAFKKLLIYALKITAADVATGPYYHSAFFIGLDPANVANVGNPNYPGNKPTGRIFVGDVFVRASDGTDKRGFKLTYNPNSGYLAIAEGTSTFVAGDTITVVGTLEPVADPTSKEVPPNFT